MTNQAATISILLLLLFPAGLILLQVFLSRSRQKWPGLILPLLSFVLSLAAVLGLTLFTFTSTVHTQSVAEDGSIIEEHTEQVPRSNAQLPGTLTAAVVTFFVYNIFTLVLVAVYVFCRKKKIHVQQLKK